MTARHLAAMDLVPVRVEPEYRVPALSAQDVVVDFDAHLVHVGGRAVVMPPKELQLLAVLVGSAGSVVPRSKLSEAAWDPGAAPAKSLDVHIRRLRQRIELDPSRPRYIRTVRGFGYIFDVVTPSRSADRHEAPEAMRQLHRGRQAC